MPQSRCLTLAASAMLICALSLSSSAFCGEIFDNEKLMDLIKAHKSLKVILNRIQTNPSDCHFTYDTKTSIELQKTAEEAKWTPADIDTLDIKINELAQQGLKDLKTKVFIFMGACENLATVADRETDQQYQEQLRRIVLSGSPVVPYLLDNLITQESDRKRVGILHVLERLGDKSAVILKQCMMLLDDPRSAPVRAQAAKTVATLSGPETGDQLIALLGRRDSLADGVALALGYMRYQKAIEPLVQMLKNSRDSQEKVSAAYSLGEMRARTGGAPEALLFAILDDKDERLRATASRAAALIGISATPDYIIKAYDRFRPGRREIIENLAYFKSIDAANFLADKLDDDDNQIRKNAMETLERMTGEKYESREQWKVYIETLAYRPEWKVQKETGKLPDVNDPK